MEISCSATAVADPAFGHRGALDADVRYNYARSAPFRVTTLLIFRRNADSAPGARATMTSTSRYVHGFGADEQRRLTDLNALMNAACLKELALRGSERVLDVGAGLGQLSRDLARASGRRVLAIEYSADQISEALRQAEAGGERELVEFRLGNALDPPLSSDEWGTFDVVHGRFILEHVSDPLLAVRHMVRAARPGGRIVLADDDHDVLRLWPEPPGVMQVWRAYQRTYDRNGNDPVVGRRLVSLLYEAGAEPVRSTWIFFGACAGEPMFVPLVENMARILEGARESIVGPGLVDAIAFGDSLRELRGWGQRPDAALWFSICWAEGRKPQA
jgi:SAM-dependent methyltransferase